MQEDPDRRLEGSGRGGLGDAPQEVSLALFGFGEVRYALVSSGEGAVERRHPERPSLEEEQISQRASLQDSLWQRRPGSPRKQERLNRGALPQGSRSLK